MKSKVSKIEIIGETKSYFLFKKIKKIDAILESLTKLNEKRYNSPRSKMKEVITSEPAPTKRITREYCERLCAHRIDNL